MIEEGRKGYLAISKALTSTPGICNVAILQGLASLLTEEVLRNVFRSVDAGFDGRR